MNTGFSFKISDYEYHTKTNLKNNPNEKITLDSSNRICGY